MQLSEVKDPRMKFAAWQIMQDEYSGNAINNTNPLLNEENTAKAVTFNTGKIQMKLELQPGTFTI